MRSRNPDRSKWRLACDGEIGNAYYWRRGFEDIKRVIDLLSGLEELGERKTPWRKILDGSSYFEKLRTMSFPPLYNLDDLENFEGFEVVVEEPSVHSVNSTYMRIWIFVEREKKKQICKHFRLLARRLESVVDRPSW